MHRDNRLLEKLRNESFMKFLETRDVEIKNFTYEGGDSLEQYLKQEIKLLRKQNLHFTKTFYDKMSSSINRAEGTTFGGFKIEVGQQLPVALAGRGNFYITGGKKNIREIELILHVIPTLSNTLISIFCAKKDERAVESYLDHFLSQDFGIINMVESWMVYGSDHWFLKPSVWEQITPNNQSFLLDEIRNVRNTISMNNPKTIFNELKRSNFPSFQDVKSIDEYDAMIQHEQSKFTD